MFDFSEYPLDLKFFDPVNKKVADKMKDEYKGKIIREFVGLKSKLYSLISVDNEELTKAKGVNKKIRHKEFVDVLFNKKVIRHNMKRIQSKLHKIGTYDSCKISLSYLDDKRFVLDSICISSIDYILEVDIEYPSQFHKSHNDYPLAPEKLEISQNMLTKYCFNIANEYGIKIGNKLVNKLVPNLGNKSKYVVHYRNLQLYLSLGRKLTKTHRVLKFKQYNWLKKFIDFNTD